MELSDEVVGVDEEVNCYHPGEGRGPSFEALAKFFCYTVIKGNEVNFYRENNAS